MHGDSSLGPKSSSQKVLGLKYSGESLWWRRDPGSGRARPGMSSGEGLQMRVACLGGGPAGLYFAISMKLRDPSHEVTVFERNRPDDTFGWGVVLSDEALGNLAANDPVSAAAIRANFAYWDDIAVEFKGTRTVSSGHGFCGIGRMKLLLLLQARARELGCRAALPERRQRGRHRAAVARLRPGGGERRAELQDPHRTTPSTSGPTSTCAGASSSGSARIRSSTTPSPSSSRRPSTAGSGPMPTSSTPTPRPSSSSARRRPGRRSASARCRRTRRSPPASGSSPRSSAATS